jgi:DNA primase
MTEAQIELLWRYGQEPVLCFDGDSAGQRAAARAVERALPLLQPGYSLRFAILPAGEDPDSLVQGQGPDGFRKLLDGAKPLVDMIWEIETAGRKFATPERRAALRKALRDKAALIPDRSVQGFYFDEFEARLNRAFKQSGRAGGYGRERGRQNWPRRYPLPWYEQYQDPGLKSDGNVDVLRLRREQALVATILTHPELLEEFAETFADFNFSAGGAELDKIRQEILLKQASGLDSNALLNHLRELGFSALLERILCREVFELAPFARPGTDTAAAKAGWRHLSDSYMQRTRMERELDAARHAFATDPTERNWAFLDALKRQATPQNPLLDEGADGEDESADERISKADRAG